MSIRPGLAELSPDLQIHICGFLHPFQIIALRRTCKVFRDITSSQRIIWIHTLNRLCRENLLFRPTFPIHDMSVVELERAATAPLRWIALSSSEARDNDGCLPSRATRRLKHPTQSMMDRLKITSIFRSCHGRPYLVPGGRYLVINGPNCLGVWDLGHVSDDDSMPPNGKPPKMWATGVDGIKLFRVHPTPDGLGIRIFTECVGVRVDTLYVFEIYPQSENPELARIGQLILHQQYQLVTFFFHGNKVIINARLKRTVIVWDFITNAVASWSIDSRLHLRDNIIRVTETYIIISHHPNDRPALWIFQIPPLITKTPSLDSQELDFPELSPDFTFAYPELASLSQIPDEWYYGDLSSLPVYFEMFESHKRDAFTQCKLDITSDLSNISFAPIFEPSLPWSPGPSPYANVMMEYRICEGRPVNVFRIGLLTPVEVYTSSGPTLGFGLSSDCHYSGRTPSSVPTPLATSSDFFSFCPASGRLVLKIGRELDGDIVIRDFL